MKKFCHSLPFSNSVGVMLGLILLKPKSQEIEVPHTFQVGNGHTKTVCDMEQAFNDFFIVVNYMSMINIYIGQ